jgi:hypothetical protein
VSESRVDWAWLTQGPRDQALGDPFVRQGGRRAAGYLAWNVIGKDTQAGVLTSWFIAGVNS